VRLIKMFSLAALAVVALMAFIGATSASAVTSLEEVVLCKVSNEDPCAAANRFGSGTVLHGELVSGTQALLLGNDFVGPVVVHCTASTTLGTTTSSLAHGEITALGFTGCTNLRDGKTCTTTTEHLNYLVKGELKSGDSGCEVLITEKAGNGRPEVRLKCESLGINCQYGAATVLFEALGASGSADTVLDVLQELEGLGFCFTESIWHAEYLVRCLNASSQNVGCWLRME
jgi:hypothetical protein